MPFEHLDEFDQLKQQAADDAVNKMKQELIDQGIKQGYQEANNKWRRNALFLIGGSFLTGLMFSMDGSLSRFFLFGIITLAAYLMLINHKDS